MKIGFFYVGVFIKYTNSLFRLEIWNFWFVKVQIRFWPFLLSEFMLIPILSFLNFFWNEAFLVFFVWLLCVCRFFINVFCFEGMNFVEHWHDPVLDLINLIAAVSVLGELHFWLNFTAIFPKQALIVFNRSLFFLFARNVGNHIYQCILSLITGLVRAFWVLCFLCFTDVSLICNHLLCFSVNLGRKN